MRAMPDESCEWSAEITDDSMKEMFISEALYCSGKKGDAIARIDRQMKERIPVIEKRASTMGGDTQSAQKVSMDLQRFRKAMEDGVGCGALDELARQIDTAHALPAYHSFCKCMSKK